MSNAGGVNDVIILAGIIAFCIAMGVVTPLIESAMQTGNEGTLAEDYLGSSVPLADINQTGLGGIGTWVTGGLDMVGPMLKAFFLVESWAPWWLSIIHIFLRVLGLVIGYRLLRSGAG